jgi:hypothetical protein
MILDPTIRAEVIERTAAILAQEIRQGCGSVEEIILIDVAHAAQALGCSRPQVRKLLKPVRVSPRIEGVPLADLRKFITSRQKKPLKISRK